MEMHKKISLLFVLVLIGPFVFSQTFFRIKADYSIKFQGMDNSKFLTTGVIYYDKNHKTTVYKSIFPETETWVTVDTVLVKVKGEQIIERVKVPGMAEFSIFHMILNGNLTNYGLDESDFSIEKVEKENDMIITTWSPPAQLTSSLGKVLISTKNKKLFGIVFFDAMSNVTAKHFFLEYKNVSGLEIPTEVRQINYVNGKKSLQLLSVKNIVLNATDENDIYNYKLPDSW